MWIKEIRHCKVCNESFPRKKKLKEGREKIYCSMDCYRIFQRSGEYKIPKARKSVLVPCLICGTEFYTGKGKRQKYCSRECYLVKHTKNTVTKDCPICGKEFMKHKRHPFCSHECYYKYHETEYSSGKQVIWNKGQTKENNESILSISETLKERYEAGEIEVWSKGQTLSKEYGEKISRGKVQSFIDNPGINTGSRGKSGHFFSKKNNQEIHYRSSYELVAYELLEQMSVVESYEIESVWIPYEYQGRKRHTIPDILITYENGKKELVEVKPAFRLEEEQTNVKLEAMENYADENDMSFSIWTEKELGIER